MTLNLSSPPFLSRFSPPHFTRLFETSPSSFDGSSFWNLLFRSSSASSVLIKARPLKPRASVSENPNKGCEESSFLDGELLGRVSGAKDAAEALEIIALSNGRNGGAVEASDCRLIIKAALDCGNADLALSVFYAMRSSFDSDVGENGPLVEKWKWSRPDVSVYTLLVQALASSLRVSDSLRIVDEICRVGVSPGEEVPFGKVVRCPTCMIAISVSQPQHGIQIVSCAKCRYQYELFSGDIVSVQSEEIRLVYLYL